MEANIERLYNPNDYFKCLKCGQKWSHAPCGAYLLTGTPSLSNPPSERPHAPNPALRGPAFQLASPISPEYNAGKPRPTLVKTKAAVWQANGCSAG